MVVGPRAPPKPQKAKLRQTKIPQYFKPSTEMPTEDIDVDYQVPTEDIMMELYDNSPKRNRTDSMDTIPLVNKIMTVFGIII